MDGRRPAFELFAAAPCYPRRQAMAESAAEVLRVVMLAWLCPHPRYVFSHCCCTPMWPNSPSIRGFKSIRILVMMLGDGSSAPYVPADISGGAAFHPVPLPFPLTGKKIERDCLAIPASVG